MYSGYCAGYSRMLNKVEALRASTPALASLEQQLGQRLESLLIKPVQRLCKYPLFFPQLLAAVPRRGRRTSVARGRE